MKHSEENFRLFLRTVGLEFPHDRMGVYRFARFYVEHVPVDDILYYCLVWSREWDKASKRETGKWDVYHTPKGKFRQWSQPTEQHRMATTRLFSLLNTSPCLFIPPSDLQLLVCLELLDSDSNPVPTSRGHKIATTAEARRKGELTRWRSIRQLSEKKQEGLREWVLRTLNGETYRHAGNFQRDPSVNEHRRCHVRDT